MVVLKITGSLFVGVLLLWLLMPIGKRKKKGFYGLAGYHYAHRGLHGPGVPENSLLAFRLAVQAGYGIELDVHLTRDGRLVVMHDESLRRTVGVEKNLCDCTAGELKAMRLKDSREPIPFLEEVLPLFSGKTPMIIELKCCKGNHKELTDKVCALLAAYPDVKFCIESFDPRVLIHLQKKHPHIIRGQLSCHFDKNSGIGAGLRFVLRNLLMNFVCYPHFVAYCHTDRGNPSFWICRKLWQVQEFSWTVRSAKEAEPLLGEGAMIIFEHFKP